MGLRTLSIVQEFIWYNCSAVCGSSVQCLYGGTNGDLLQKGLCHTQVCCTQSPCPCGRPLLTRTSTGDTQTQFWLSPCGLGVHFAPFPGLICSGDQVLGECTVPGGPCILITSPSWPLGVPGVPCVSSVELISGCNPPGSCQPSRISGRCG